MPAVSIRMLIVAAAAVPVNHSLAVLAAVGDGAPGPARRRPGVTVGRPGLPPPVASEPPGGRRPTSS